jgi:hypothetical protein
MLTDLLKDRGCPLVQRFDKFGRWMESKFHQDLVSKSWTSFGRPNYRCIILPHIFVVYDIIGKYPVSGQGKLQIRMFGVPVYEIDACSSC